MVENLEQMVGVVGGVSQLTNSLRNNTGYKQHMSTLATAEAAGEDLAQYRVLESNPELQQAMIASEQVQRLETDVVTYAKTNKETIIGELDKKAITELAVMYSEDAKNLRLYGKMLEEGRSDFFQRELSQESSKCMRQVIQRLNGDQILQLAQGDYLSMQKGFIKNNLQKEIKDNDGNITGYEFDKEKAVNYVTGLVNAVPESKDKQTYIGLAETYAMSATRAA